MSGGGKGVDKGRSSRGMERLNRSRRWLRVEEVRTMWILYSSLSGLLCYVLSFGLVGGYIATGSCFPLWSSQSECVTLMQAAEGRVTADFSLPIVKTDDATE